MRQHTQNQHCKRVSKTNCVNMTNDDFLCILQQSSSTLPRQPGYRPDPLEGGGDPMPRQRAGHRPWIIKKDFTVHKLYLHQRRGKHKFELTKGQCFARTSTRTIYYPAHILNWSSKRVLSVK